VFTVGNLLCGFSRNLGQLIIFRAIAGLGGGGIGVLVLIIISDISTLRTRGKACHLIHLANNSTWLSWVQELLSAGQSVHY
jgi:MFS family permease